MSDLDMQGPSTSSWPYFSVWWPIVVNSCFATSPSNLQDLASRLICRTTQACVREMGTHIARPRDVRAVHERVDHQHLHFGICEVVFDGNVAVEEIVEVVTDVCGFCELFLPELELLRVALLVVGLLVGRDRYQIQAVEVRLRRGAS